MSKEKEYRKMVNKNRKAIVKNAKETAPWDYGWLLESIILNLKYMKEYYELGVHVMALEDCDVDITKKDELTRAEMCKQILDAYNAWQGCEDKYYIYHETGGRENGRGTLINGERSDYWIEYLIKDPDKNREAFNKEYKETKHKFFELLEDYLEKLWD